MAPRTAQVIVGGMQSEAFSIQDVVYQGTVLGPVLWCVYFNDVENNLSVDRDPVHSHKFADDLVCFQQFDCSWSNADILSKMEHHQTAVHKWGSLHRVEFDPSKEHMMVLHHRDGLGEPFKLLGATIDCKLLMHGTVENLIAKARLELKSLLSCRRFYGVSDLVVMFKSLCQ